MKKFIALVIVSFILLTGITAFAAENPDNYNKVIVDGKELLLDVKPQLVEGRMLVPFRAIVEALGGEVGWDGATGTVTAKKGNITVVLQINNIEAKVNGVKKTLDVPAKIIGNRTLVPIRFLSENLGAEVVWDYLESKAVILSAAEDTHKPETKPQDKPQEQQGGTPPASVPVTPPAGGNETVDKEALKQQIINKYSSQANALRDEGMSKISSLVSQAVSEYKSLPADQRTGEAKMALFLKYLPEAAKVEEDTKSGFDSVLNSMQQELEANGLPVDAVQSARDEYDRQRQELINSLQNQL